MILNERVKGQDVSITVQLCGLSCVCDFVLSAERNLWWNVIDLEGQIHIAAAQRHNAKSISVREKNIKDLRNLTGKNLYQSTVNTWNANFKKKSKNKEYSQIVSVFPLK